MRMQAKANTSVVRTIILGVVMFVLVASYPMQAMAETQEGALSTPASPPGTTEPSQPTETVPAATEQAPATDQPSQPAEEERPKVNYTYDPTTNRWSSDEWQYDAASDTYIKPAPVTIVEPEPSISDESDSTLEKDIDTKVDIKNDITSDAQSGDALVFKNTNAGNATSGDAEVTANVLNVVNSTIGTQQNQKVAEFTQDILGDVHGDIILSPLLLKAFLEAEAPAYGNTTINANNNLSIENNLLLNAGSGNATVAQNTNAGNATTGSASAVANVVNVLNSLIAAQQSFIGTINIYGNLEGDILIAPDFIPQLIESNGSKDADVTLNSKDTQDIVNNVSAVAKSGAASVFGNTNAGSAVSGDALSNVVIFNLSGHEIIAENSMLVFVNVLGKWVGVIVDAPEGATAGLIGNGVQKSVQQVPDLTVNSESKHGITNTIAVNAETGDATVAMNTNAGNAVTGAAKAMANVANVSNNTMNLTGWFGVLFINVFQNWFGSFGVNTPYGNIPNGSTTNQPTKPVQFIPSEDDTIIEVYDVRNTTRFVNRVATSALPTAAPAPVVEISGSVTPDVLSTETTKRQEVTAASQDYRLLIIAGSLLAIGLSVIGLRRILS